MLTFDLCTLQVVAHCQQFTHDPDQPLIMVEATQWNNAFMVDGEYCANLLREERPFTRLLQVKQRPDKYNKEYYRSIERRQLLAITDRKRWF